MKDRREFIKKSAVFAFSGSMLGVISACTKDGISPFKSFSICENACTGCGDCVDSCEPTAIKLPKKSTYEIEVEGCTECCLCQPTCEVGAIKIAVSDYILDSESCVGCGLCLPECENEGNALSWERDYYKVRGKCHADECNQECIKACPENAIVIAGNKVEIDLLKCTRCGLCVAPCPMEAINPAHVQMDTNLCNNCGKCYDVCEFDCIEKVAPEGHHDPYIDEELCTSCGDCKDSCPEGVLLAHIYSAFIEKKECTACGDCLDKCKEDAIRSQ
jgi:ferredoxin